MIEQTGVGCLYKVEPFKYSSKGVTEIVWKVQHALLDMIIIQLGVPATLPFTVTGMLSLVGLSFGLLSFTCKLECSDKTLQHTVYLFNNFGSLSS